MLSGFIKNLSTYYVNTQLLTKDNNRVYTLKLNRPSTKVNKISISSINFPKSMFLINSDNNTFEMDIDDDGY
tara:strand:+ start:284 stop:499 length:216 start_codon:yes stop_codon:yes gene_type:complete